MGQNEILTGPWRAKTMTLWKILNRHWVGILELAKIFDRSVVAKNGGFQTTVLSKMQLIAYML